MFVYILHALIISLCTQHATKKARTALIQVYKWKEINLKYLN